jgi:CP family cyanate transporter-like MFS transporter
LGRTRTAAPSHAFLTVAGIVLVAVNLRASITAVGPIVDDIRADLGLSSASAGLLTTLPVLAFAGASPVAVPLSRRIGIERTLAGASGPSPAST